MTKQLAGFEIKEVEARASGPRYVVFIVTLAHTLRMVLNFQIYFWAGVDQAHSFSIYRCIGSSMISLNVPARTNAAFCCASHQRIRALGPKEE
jgi:hypothetical protein